MLDHNNKICVWNNRVHILTLTVLKCFDLNFDVKASWLFEYLPIFIRDRKENIQEPVFYKYLFSDPPLELQYERCWFARRKLTWSEFDWNVVLGYCCTLTYVASDVKRLHRWHLMERRWRILTGCLARIW